MAFNSQRRGISGNTRIQVGDFTATTGNANDVSVRPRATRFGFMWGLDTNDNALQVNVNSSTIDVDDDRTEYTVTYSAAAAADYNFYVRGR